MSNTGSVAAFINAITGLGCWCGRGVAVGRRPDIDAVDVACGRCGVLVTVSCLALRTATDASRLMRWALEQLRERAAKRRWGKVVEASFADGGMDYRMKVGGVGFAFGQRLPMQLGLTHVNLLKVRCLLYDQPGGSPKRITMDRIVDVLVQPVPPPPTDWTIDMLTAPMDVMIRREYYKRSRDLGFGWHEYRKVIDS